MYKGEGEFAESYRAVTVPPLKEMKTEQKKTRKGSSRFNFPLLSSSGRLVR
jgi:hypothetical protein